MKKVKGFLIRKEWLEKEIKIKVVEFDRDDYKELYKLIECDCFEHATRKIGNKYYDFWFDEEYLLKDYKATHITAICMNYEEMIFGNLLITNTEEGEITTLTNEDIINIQNNIKVYIASYLEKEIYPKYLLTYSL